METSKTLPPPRARPPPAGGEGRGRGRGTRGRGSVRGRYERQVQAENEKRMAHHNALVQIYTPKPIRNVFYTEDRIRYSLAGTHQLNSDKGTRHTAFHPSHLSFASLSRPFLSLNESGPLEVGGKTTLCTTLYCVINTSDTLGICTFCLGSQKESENGPSPLPFSPSSFSPSSFPKKEKEKRDVEEGKKDPEKKEMEKDSQRAKDIDHVLETCNGKNFLSQQAFRFMPTWHDIDSEFEGEMLLSTYSKSTTHEPSSKLHLPPRSSSSSSSSSSRVTPSSSLLLSSSLTPPDQEKEKQKEQKKSQEEKEKEDDDEGTGVYCQHPFPPQFQLLVSFPNGDVIRYDLVSRQLTGRYNKVGALHSAEATDVRWVPGTKCTQFVVCFNDGVLLHYNLAPNRQKEEGVSRKRGASAKKKAETGGGWSSSLSSLWASVNLTEDKIVEETPNTRATNHVVTNPSDIFFSKEKMRDTEGNADVSFWKVSNKPISRASFSKTPNSLRFAVVDREGYAKIFDWKTSTLLFCVKSYFGCFLSLEWSPCGRLLVLGGEDDAVSIVDTKKRKIVCRGEGHKSWVSALSFLDIKNNHQNKQEKKLDGGEEEGEKGRRGKKNSSLSYSFASVGQDGYLCLWSVCVDEEGRPRTRAVSGLSKRERANSVKSAPESNVMSQMVTYPKFGVPQIKPVAMHRSHHNPLSSVLYLPDGIVTTCTSGIINLWKCDSY